MIVIPTGPEHEGAVRDLIMDSSAGFRELTLYGRKVMLTDGYGLAGLSGMEKLAILVSSGLFSREAKSSDTSFEVSGVRIGGKRLVIAAGPCAVESADQICEIAENVKKAGADILRGGAYKPRTNPYKFQGLGKEGLDFLVRAKEETGLPVVSEIMDQKDYRHFQGRIDILQVGSRNSQNFSMLKFLSGVCEPVLLKNGMASSLNEWMGSAEYLLAGGNENVILCFRGTRTIEGATRFSMDTGLVSATKRASHLPLCADPSHPAGRRDYVESIALSAVAAGAGMLEIEVHRDPDNALSDAEQQLTFDQFRRLASNARKIWEIVRNAG